MPTPSWTLHPDRALPAEPGIRSLAREIYGETAPLPIVSMHGHVEADVLDEDRPFGNPAEFFVIPDHYLVRMLVSQGARNEQLGVPSSDPSAVVEQDPREIWRRFVAGWPLFRGTPTRYWVEHELVEIFGITQAFTPENADAIYDTLAQALESEAYRPRALLDRFNIEVLATTDPATATLSHHASLAAKGWGERVIPTFRPDRLTHLSTEGWAGDVAQLSEVSGIEVGDYDSYLAALRAQRQRFIAHGARATDHGHTSASTQPLPAEEASRIFAAALRGEVAPGASEAFAGHMLFESARMSRDDGLVMQLHPGVLRNHHEEAFAQLGADKGYDIPVAVEYTRSLRPLLNEFGRDSDFRLILFTIDETVYSRELAPLAGVYPTVKLGAPWWFLDSPDGMRRYRELVTETAGFYNTTGFVDDTRAFASIPARHDLARRIDAGYLARLVAEHRITLEEARETAVDLAYRLPLAAYAARAR